MPGAPTSQGELADTGQWEAAGSPRLQLRPCIALHRSPWFFSQIVLEGRIGSGQEGSIALDDLRLSPGCRTVPDSE